MEKDGRVSRFDDAESEACGNEWLIGTTILKNRRAPTLRVRRAGDCSKVFEVVTHAPAEGSGAAHQHAAMLRAGLNREMRLVRKMFCEFAMTTV
jgi:hypothetical protein